jgi:hypothetical protein
MDVNLKTAKAVSLAADVTVEEHIFPADRLPATAAGIGPAAALYVIVPIVSEQLIAMRAALTRAELIEPIVTVAAVEEVHTVPAV